MNKVLCLCAAAALAFASCSNDETVEIAKQNAISFRTVTGLSTKGVESTTANLASMWVTAYEEGASSDKPYYSNIEYTRTRTSNTFESANPFFWLKGKTIHFLALSPSANDWNATNTINFNTNDYSATFTDVTPDTNVSNQKDLLIGKASGTENTDANGLDLTLNHVLSQIQVKAKNTNASYVYTIKGVRIASVASKGTYTYPAGSWTASATDKQTYDVILTTSVTLDGTSTDAVQVMKADGDNAMLVPQQLTAWAGTTAASGDSFDKGAYISLLLNVKSNSGTYIYPSQATADTDCGWAAVAIDTNWEAGKKYVYTLDLSKGCGKVDPVTPNEEGKDIVKPGDKDSDKGEQIFGEPIKFDLTVTRWTDNTENKELK